jgi:hypothetical protein
MAAPAEAALHVARLRELVRALDDGVPLDADVARWLDRAPWTETERRALRDGMLRQLGDAFGDSRNERALRLGAEVRDYRGAGWPLDRRRGSPFPRTPRRELLFAIFSLDPDPPSSARRLNSILAACNG